MINLKDPNYRLYLPVLLDGDSPDREAVGEAPQPPDSETRRTLRGHAGGFSYPGPQPILSTFPNPTNRIQTILQPALKDPPTLVPPVTLPNIVQLPYTVPVLRPPTTQELAAVAPQERQVPAPPPSRSEVTPVDMPGKVTTQPAAALQRVMLPPGATQNHPEIALPQLIPTKVEPPPAPSNSFAPKESSVAESRSTKAPEPLLTLSPMPALQSESVKIPSGEARGHFSISPGGDLTATDAAPGGRGERASSGAGTRMATVDENATVDAASEALPSKGKDSASGGAPSSGGRGSRATVSTTTGKGNSPFAGITVLGPGDGAAAGPTISIGGNPPPLQTSYGIAIVSTEDSGGGLPQFGVFSNEEIFSVFVDMRRTMTDPTPSWTFEYGLPKQAARQANVASAPPGNQQGIILPFPITKGQPKLLPELVRQYSRRRITVYAMINVDGKLEQITVKDSPDPQLNQPVLDALTKWSFRPAQINGDSVAVKVLMGIPIFSYQ